MRCGQAERALENKKDTEEAYARLGRGESRISHESGEDRRLSEGYHTQKRDRVMNEESSRLMSELGIEEKDLHGYLTDAMTKNMRLREIKEEMEERERGSLKAKGKEDSLGTLLKVKVEAKKKRLTMLGEDDHSVG